MAFAPDITERIARARADLRMGVPVVVTGDGKGVMVLAAETLTGERLEDVRSVGDEPVLTITARRAETLKARAYDGDLARIALPADVGLNWISGVSDPATDLQNPMKGPLVTMREGDASLLRLAIMLVKSARLLPTVLSVDLPDPLKFASANDLTVIPAALAGPVLADTSHLSSVVSARLPMAASEAGRMPSKSAARRGTSLFWRVCTRLVSPETSLAV